MKTTVHLPDALYREAKAKAALEGKSMRTFLAEALESKLRGGGPTPRPWIDRLPKLPKEAAKEAKAAIESADFREIDEGMWR